MKTYFFDLDGTLADSRPGLFGAFRAGIAAIDRTCPSDDALRAYLGTPLPKFFAAIDPDISPNAMTNAIAGFRDYYNRRGIFENTLYSGASEMLGALRASGRAVWIVTSKPQEQAQSAVEFLGIGKFLSGVVGASLAETDTKTELVARAMAHAGAGAADILMLGDRSYDVIGALENRVTPVGALWGYGDKTELRAAGCRLFAVSIVDFTARFVAKGSPVDMAAAS